MTVVSKLKLTVISSS